MRTIRTAADGALPYFAIRPCFPVRSRAEITLTFGGKYRCLYSRREPRAYGAYVRGEATKKTNTWNSAPKGWRSFGRLSRCLLVIPTLRGRDSSQPDNQSKIPASKCKSYFCTAPNSWSSHYKIHRKGKQSWGLSLQTEMELFPCIQG